MAVVGGCWVCALGHRFWAGFGGGRAVSLTLSVSGARRVEKWSAIIIDEPGFDSLAASFPLRVGAFCCISDFFQMTCCDRARPAGREWESRGP